MPTRLARVLKPTIFALVCIGSWLLLVRPTLTGSSSTVPVPVSALSVDGLHSLGSPDARVGVLLFSDFECPVCSQFARTVMPKLVASYVSTNKVLLLFSDLPLPIHRTAFQRAVIAECADRQDRFWAVHDALFALRVTESINSVTKNLDPTQLTQCLSTKPDEVILQRIAVAHTLGVSATPTIFVGRMVHKQIHVVTTRVGLQSFDDVSAVLSVLLQSKQ